MKYAFQSYFLFLLFYRFAVILILEICVAFMNAFKRVVIVAKFLAC